MPRPAMTAAGGRPESRHIGTLPPSCPDSFRGDNRGDPVPPGLHPPRLLPRAGGRREAGRRRDSPSPRGERAGVRGDAATGYDRGRWKARIPAHRHPFLRHARTCSGHPRPSAASPSRPAPAVLAPVVTPEQVRGDNRGDPRTARPPPSPAPPASGRGEAKAGAAPPISSPRRGEGRGEGRKPRAPPPHNPVSIRTGGG